MTKGQTTIRVIAGGYLAYIGFKLVRDSIMQKPEHYMIYLLFGAVFMAFGGIWCVMALKRYMKGDFSETAGNLKGEISHKEREDAAKNAGVQKSGEETETDTETKTETRRKE